MHAGELALAAGTGGVNEEAQEVEVRYAVAEARRANLLTLLPVTVLLVGDLNSRWS